MPKFLKSWQIYPLQFIVVHRFHEGQERPTLVLALRWVAFMVPNIFWLRRDRQTDTQADKQTDRQRDSPMDTPTNGRTDRHIHGRTDRQASRQTYRQTTDRRTDDWTDGLWDRETQREKHRRQTVRQDKTDGRTDGHMDRRRDRYNGCPPTTTRLLPHASAQRCAQNIDLLPPRLSCKWVLSSFGSCCSQNITKQHFEVSNVLCRVPASKSHPL